MYIINFSRTHEVLAVSTTFIEQYNVSPSSWEIAEWPGFEWWSLIEKIESFEAKKILAWYDEVYDYEP